MEEKKEEIMNIFNDNELKMLYDTIKYELEQLGAGNRPLFSVNDIINLVHIYEKIERMIYNE